MIDAKGITKVYVNGEVENHVLHGIDLHVPKGQFTSLIGKSGAGKSTLLYQLSLLDVPTAGTVSLDGQATSHLSDKEKTAFRLDKLGYIFQDYALLPELTAQENVMVPLMMMGREKGEVLKRSKDALEKVGLGHRLNNPPTKLSGGEQQRVSVARAVANTPAILFADEPTANLDTETSKLVMKLLLDLHEKGQTIVMVTHEREYSAMTERVVQLEDGRIISDTMN